MTNELIDVYFKIKKDIHKAFGYAEDWKVIPLEDFRDYYWNLTENSKDYIDDAVRYHEEKLTKDLIEGGAHYSAEIYTQRFLKKWVYKTENFTLICMDTQVDGNKFLGIFDNSKECPAVANITY